MPRPFAGQQQAACVTRETGIATSLDAGPSSSHGTEAGPAADGDVPVVAGRLAVQGGPDENRRHDVMLTADADSSCVGSSADWLLHDADAIAVQATTEVETTFADLACRL